MAIHNISVGEDAPQHRHGLFQLLAGLDQAQVELFLSSFEGSSPRQRSPFSGLLLSLKYDPSQVRDLVDEIWPERVSAPQGPGRKTLDRLPLVCYLLPHCDAEYGTILNLREVHRLLKGNEQYRTLFGYTERVPSYSVFRSTAVAIAEHWPAFQMCVASGERMEALLAGSGLSPVGFPKGTNGVKSASPYAAELLQLGW